MTPAIISHRGGALLWPENSRIACEATVALGAEQLQVDVHPSRDGEVVVIHDATLDRTTSGSGPVAARDWAELSRLTLKGTDQGMLLLADVIEIVRDSPVRLRLEIKPDGAKTPYPGFAASVGQVLDRAGTMARTIVTGFQVETVADTAAFPTPLGRTWLVSADVLAAEDLDGVIATAQKHNVPGLGLRWNQLDAAMLAQLRDAGLRVGVFACNDASAISSALALGVDEIMTDRPDLALAQRALS